MISIIIPAAALIISLGVLAYIYLPKFRQIASLDVAALRSVQQKHSKENLIEQKIKRIFRERFTGGWINLFDLAIKASRASVQVFRNIYRRLEKLEKQYEKELLKSAHRQRSLPQKLATIEDLLNEARTLASNGEYGQAEERLLEVITQEPKNVLAYEFLGDIYLEQEQVAEAKETYSFLIKINPENINGLNKLVHIAEKTNDWPGLKNAARQLTDLAGQRAESFFALGFACFNLGEYREAKVNFRRACEIEPGNPRYLDYLLQVSIILKDLRQAENTFRKLSDVNSDNQKLGEFQEQIQELKKKK